MTLEDIKQILEQTGLPVAYHSFPEKDAPPLPFIVYLAPSSKNFCADGVVYVKGMHIQVELYTQWKNVKLEDKVEQALSSFFWKKTEIYLDDEQCFEILYELEV